MKIILILALFAFPVFAQQLDYTYGIKSTSGDAWTGAGLAYIDTTTGTTNDILIDMRYYYPYELSPLVNNDSAVVAINSDRQYFGTFYCLFDNEGTKAPTTDSLKYTIKAYPGIYTDATRTVANLKYGSAITLETITTRGDYFTWQNVYLSTSKYKMYPPEIIKIEIAPVGDIDTDDSTHVSWKFAYPAIHQDYKERKTDE